MARTIRTPARRRALAVLTAGATVATGAAFLAPGTSSASSHREAPYIAGDPAVDNTDTYAFVSPDKSSTATLIGNWAPFSDPAGGPNFFPWATDAQYNINIDNNGDAKPDIIYRWTFKDVDKRGQNGGSFLYNNGKVTTLEDVNLLFRQTYTLVEIKGASTATPTTTTLLTDIPVAPSNVGAASIPSYANLRTEAVSRGTFDSGLSHSYVGQADDSFFLDLRIFDLLYGGKIKSTGFAESGYDTLSNYNVNTIALQVPKTDLSDGAVATNPVVGVWSTTDRQSVRTLAATNSAPTTSVSRSSDTALPNIEPSYVQVSRLGVPLVNEAVVPANLKDFFNRSTPDKDGQFLGKVTNPEVPILVEGIYGVPNPNKLSGSAQRPDLVKAFLTGLPGLNATSMNANNASPAPAEYLRLNLNIAPTASPKRLGALAGDNAGFPNGRRLTDDVVDIALQVLEGVLIKNQDPGVKAAVKGLGDGVNTNDHAFLKIFPYIADPNSGSNPNPGQSPVTLRQSLYSGGGFVAAQAQRISPRQPGARITLSELRDDGSIFIRSDTILTGDGVNGPVTTFQVGARKIVRLFYTVYPVAGSPNSPGPSSPTTIVVR